MKRNNSKEICFINEQYSLLKQMFHKYVYFNEGLDSERKNIVKEIIRSDFSSKKNQKKDPLYKFGLSV